MGQVGARPASPLTLLGEYAQALRLLLDGQEVTVSGRYVRLDRVRLDWPPEPGTPAHRRCRPEDPRAGRPARRRHHHRLRGVRDGAPGTRWRRGEPAGRDGCTDAGRHPPPRGDRARCGAATGRGARSVGPHRRRSRPGVAGDAPTVADAVRRLAALGATTVVVQPTEDEPDLEGLVKFVGQDVEVGAGSLRAARSRTPSATSTAGPASSTPWSGRSRTVSRPPGTSTSHVAPVSSEPAQRLVAIAAAHAPSRTSATSPTPRSCTRRAMCGPIGRTSSTLVPCSGLRTATGAAVRSMASRSTCSGSATTVCGLPRSTVRAGRGRRRRGARGRRSRRARRSPRHRGARDRGRRRTLTVEADPLCPGAGADRELVGRLEALAPQEGGEDARPVPAHLRHAAVGVAVVHEPAGAIHPGPTSGSSTRSLGTTRMTPSPPTPVRRSARAIA